jgi:hypothetical protein
MTNKKPIFNGIREAKPYDWKILDNIGLPS